MITAQEIMTREVITVPRETPVRELAELLWEKRINGVVVVDDAQKPIGVVTESDLIDQTKKVHIPTVVTLLDSVFYLESSDRLEHDIRKMSSATAGEIASASFKSVSPETPMDEIATIMAEEHVHTLPVLDNGALVGVIGKADIIRTLARH